MRFAAARTTGALFLLLCVAVPSRAQESFPTDVACDTAPAVLRNSAFKLVPGAVGGHASLLARRPELESRIRKRRVGLCLPGQVSGQSPRPRFLEALLVRC